MPRPRNGVIPLKPLPAGWEEGKTNDGKPYFIDHNSKRTSWVDPRDREIKPKTFADCIGQELPIGWEECHDDMIGLYYIDHNKESNQLEDPRQQWHAEQQLMLRDYLQRNERDIEAQHNLLHVKQRRLLLAQEKVGYLEELEKERYVQEEDQMSPAKSKYDSNQLKLDIATARERVDNLKKELHNVSDEVRHQEEGHNRLEKINETLSTNGPYQVDMAREKVGKMKEVREQLLVGEQEKIRILQDLLRQRDMYQSDTAGYNQKAGSCTSLNSTGSNGVPSPLNGSEENVNTNKRQLRKDYQLALQHVQKLQASLELIDYRLKNSQNNTEQHRIALYNEKQQLYAELQRFDDYIRTEKERMHLENEKDLLNNELLSMRDLSAKALEDRKHLENERKMLQTQLAEKTQQTNLLEMRLKSLSTSTLSVSSTSSRGSLSTGSRGSLSASSRGSLNSLGLYGGGGSDVSNGVDHYSNGNMCMAHSTTCPPIYEQSIYSSSSFTKEESTDGLSITYDQQNGQMSSSRISLTSISPPISPMTPMSYTDVANLRRPVQQTTGSNERLHKSAEEGLNQYSNPVNQYQYMMGGSSELPHSVYPAVSNESVAADSGVFEAAQQHHRHHKVSVTRQDSGHSSGVYCGEDNIETAQVRIGLEYKSNDGKLVISVGKGRNMKALCFEQVHQLYLKGRLLPCSDSSLRFKTRKCELSSQPWFNQQFLFKINRNKLLNKVLMLDVYGDVIETGKEQCLGGVQISLADFDYNKQLGLKWYNLLSSNFMESQQSGLSVSSFGRSVSSVSLENMQQQQHSLSSLNRQISESDMLSSSSANHHRRMRSNSWQEKISLGSHTSCESSSINGSVEQLPLLQSSLQSSLTSLHLQHGRSKSEESEHLPIDANVNRSVSDCTGCRRSFRIPFERMGVGRRSVRQSRIAELKHNSGSSTSSGFSPFVSRRFPSLHRPPPPPPQVSSSSNIAPFFPSMTSVDIEMELQAAFTKQNKLNEEIDRLKEIKCIIEEQGADGQVQYPQWLVENGENLDALLDDAKKEFSTLSETTSFLSSSLKSKYTNVAKTNPKQANVMGFQDKMRFFTTNQQSTKLPNPEVHWV